MVIFSSLLSQAEVTLTVGNGSGVPGSSENQVEVSLNNLDDTIKGVQMDVCDADDYLTCTECDTTERTTGFICETNEIENGCCRVVVAFGLIEEGTGPLIILTYDVSGEAPEGECRDLSPERVKVSGETGELPPEEVIVETGEFCFLKPEVSIDIWPNSLWKSRWIPLPYLMIIKGEGTHFKFFKTTLEYNPPGVVFPFWPLVLSELYIWDIVLVMPGWLAGKEDQTATITVTTEEEVVESDFTINLLPFIFFN